jgi:hypothetical protein
MKSGYLIEQGEQGAHGVMALAFMPSLNFKPKKTSITRFRTTHVKCMHFYGANPSIIAPPSCQIQQKLLKIFG